MLLKFLVKMDDDEYEDPDEDGYDEDLWED
jgi:hypothetical protein